MTVSNSVNPGATLSRSSIDEWAAERGIGKVSFPAGFDWDFDKYPVEVLREGRGKYVTTFDPKVHIAAIKALFDGVASGTTKVYYADRAMANNNGDGLTMATAKQGIRRAIALGEADASAQAIIVYVNGNNGQDYDRSADFLDTGAGTILPSKPTAIIAVGGRPTISPTALLAFTEDVSSYRAARSSVGFVISKTAVDADGVPKKFARLASEAAVKASTGTDVYYTDNATVWIKRADGAAVTNANTRVLLKAACIRTNEPSIYVSGFDLMGGFAGVVQANSGGAGDIVLTDNRYMFPGSDGDVDVNCITVDRAGLTVSIRDTFGEATNDSVNPHGRYGRSPVLVIEPTFLGTGLAPNNSCNLLTGHGPNIDAGEPYANIMIVIGGKGKNGGGGSVAFIQGAKCALFGLVIDSDRGDVRFGGTYPSTALRTTGSGEIWAYEPTIKRCEIAAYTGSGSKIHLRNPLIAGGRLVANGIIDSF